MFYVALTRAEKQVYLCYAQSRYRWGKLVDCEPSRFLEEIDERYLEYLSPKTEPRSNAFLDKDIFGSPEPDRIRFKKPLQRKPVKRPGKQPERESSPGPARPSGKNYTKLSEVSKGVPSEVEGLSAGSLVEHGKFGRGQVISLEGSGGNQKAEIRFDSGETKKLLLQFAKLKIIE